MNSTMNDFHLSLLDQTAMRIYVRNLLFFRIPHNGHLKDAVQALRAGFATTVRQLPFLAGNLSLAHPDTGRLTLQYPQHVSNQLIDRILTFSFDQLGNPELEYTKMEKDGFSPMPIWRELFCPSMLRNHPGLDDKYAAGMITFKNGISVPVFAVQATFIRGGLVLSVYSHHNAIDGTGMAKVYQILSENTRSQVSKLVPKDSGIPSIGLDSQRHWMDSLAKSSEQIDCPDIRHPGTQRAAPLLRKEPYQLASKIFVFSAATVSDLASILSSATNKRISSFAALVSLIWTKISFARSATLKDKRVRYVKLGIAFNHRKNFHRQLKDSYLGNCVTEITASVPVSTLRFNTSNDSPYTKQLAPVASTISEKLSSVTLSWLKPRLNLLSRTPKPWQLRSQNEVINGPDLLVTSWMHIGTQCAWEIPGTTTEGPVAIRQPQEPMEGLILILPKVRLENESPALEVLICLEEGEMEKVVRALEGEKWAVQVIDA